MMMISSSSSPRRYKRASACSFRHGKLCPRCGSAGAVLLLTQGERCRSMPWRFLTWFATSRTPSTKVRASAREFSMPCTLCASTLTSSYLRADLMLEALNVLPLSKVASSANAGKPTFFSPGQATISALLGSRCVALRTHSLSSGAYLSKLAVPQTRYSGIFLGPARDSRCQPPSNASVGECNATGGHRLEQAHVGSQRARIHVGKIADVAQVSAIRALHACCRGRGRRLQTTRRGLYRGFARQSDPRTRAGPCAWLRGLMEQERTCQYGARAARRNRATVWSTGSGSRLSDLRRALK